jgi:quinol monooxygenase YgiN
MFARILEFEIKMEKKDEFLKIVKKDVLPIMKKQAGFLEILPFMPEDVKERKLINISLWNRKQDAERYEKESYAKVLDILKPYMIGTPLVHWYNVEATLCEHFVNALAA